MAANSRGGGKSSSKSEDVEILLKRIDEQNELIGRLQSKFRDVTHAYRSLKAENQALEITIKSLKTKKNSVSTSDSSTSLATTKPAASPSQTDIQEASAKQARTETSGNDDQLKKIEQDASNEEKIAALTANIQVVLENKARLEANYQAEKKKLRAEMEELKTKLEVFKQESQKNNESYESKLKELKNNLKQSQSDRENLTIELNNMLKFKQSEQDNKVLSIQEENQSVMMGLRAENNDLKIRIKNLNKQFENKCEELVQFDNEFKKLKLLHEEQLKTDETELASLRSQLREQTQTNETRVRDLESRIAQLCSVIANYETTCVMESKEHEAYNDDARQQIPSPRFISPQKSKTLEKEMGELNLKSSDKMDFDSAIEQISHLKSYIESTARELNINFNFNEIWFQSGEFNSKLEKEKQKELENLNTKLKEENRHLKEEYEKFKIRTNYLIKSAKHLNKENQEGGSQSSSEIQQQQQQISKLKEEIETLKKRLIVLRQEKDDEFNLESERHEREESHLRLEMRQQYEKLENERLKCVGDLELELKKQRERTLKLLAEKEAEIEQLTQQHRIKAFVKSRVVNDDSSPESNASSLGDPSTNSGDGQTTSNGTLPTLMLDPAEATAAELGANYMLYYNQQLAYKDSELNRLRVAKSDLEYKLKQLADEHSVDIERMQAQIGLLKDEIERCKLNDARVDLNRENLEYIKNVVFNYMTARDANVRASMINAIIQILKFSKSEKMKLNQMMNGTGGAGAGAAVGSQSSSTGKLP